MKFKLENPQHQITAIHSVVEVFRGMEKNTYDNAHMEDIHSNVCSLSLQELMNNIKRIITENNVPANQSCIIESNDACIEMETGTGKTLTYIQTAYELYKEYGLTKFIVLVPSIPIRQGVIDTFDCFKEQLEDKYDVQANAFVYDSSKLSKLRDFITQDTPQIMVMTMASFNSDDKILNQSEREGLFNNDDLKHLITRLILEKEIFSSYCYINVNVINKEENRIQNCDTNCIKQEVNTSHSFCTCIYTNSSQNS